MTQNPAQANTDGGIPVLETVYAKTDMTELVDVIQSLANENKKSIDELTKLHRSMYNNIIQKQNDELENYRSKTLRSATAPILCAIAEIYNDNYSDAETTENPAELLRYVISKLRDLLEGNGVKIQESKQGDAFDRKLMRTQERHTVSTPDPTQDRTVAESITPGFSFFGEPLLQELVKVYKYTQTQMDVESESQSEEVSDSVNEENAAETDVAVPQDDAETIQETANCSKVNPEEIASVHPHDVQSEEKISIESEELTHV